MKTGIFFIRNTQIRKKQKVSFKNEKNLLILIVDLNSSIQTHEWHVSFWNPYFIISVTLLNNLISVTRLRTRNN